MKDEIVKLLQQLAEQLGVASEVIWSALIKQAYISGITKLVIAPTVFVVSLTVALVAWKRYRKLEDADTPDNRIPESALMIPTILAVVGALAAGLSGAVIIITVSDAISAILNPEYHALKQLSHLLGSGR